MSALCHEDRIETGPAAGTMMRVYPGAGGLRAAPIVLHLHGGAFVGGSLACGGIVSSLLAQAGATVVSAAYPLACTQPFPHGLDVAYGALTWLHDNRTRFGARASKVFVAGEEAGGNLAAALALMARDQRMPPLAGQILLCPMLDACLATPSLRAADAGSEACKWAKGWRAYLGTADKAAHPYAAPLQASRLTGIAPALIITSNDDPMRDEALRYGARLQQAGVPASAHVITSDTGWPDSLGALDADATQGHASSWEALFAAESWPAAVRGLFAAFLRDPSADFSHLATAAPAAAGADLSR